MEKSDIVRDNHSILNGFTKKKSNIGLFKTDKAEKGGKEVNSQRKLKKRQKLKEDLSNLLTSTFLFYVLCYMDFIYKIGGNTSVLDFNLKMCIGILLQSPF